MATRSRTTLFIQYRHSFARSSGRQSPQHAQQAIQGIALASSERVGLMQDASSVTGATRRPLHDENNSPERDSVSIEMSALPPAWMDLVDEVDEHLAWIKEHMQTLESMHKKHLLPGFTDNEQDERAIELMGDQITKRFQLCQRKIMQIGTQEKSKSATSDQATQLTRNVQTSLATKVQDLSSQFRKSQSSYMQKLQGREARGRDLFAAGGHIEAIGDVSQPVAAEGFSVAQMAVLESNEVAIDQRTREINDIAKSIHALADLFKELQTMVIDQGTVLDRIDYNIEQVQVHTKDAVAELEQASKYDKAYRKKWLIFFLVLVVIAMIMAVIYKPTRQQS